MPKNFPDLSSDDFAIFAGRLIFIDLEASDGGPDAWPIELGWSRLAERFTPGAPVESTTKSWLIQPAPHWPADKWSPYAERVHHIRRADLDDAPDYLTVRKLFLNDLRANSIIVSDSPRNDQPWLDRLLGEADRQEVQSIWGVLDPIYPQADIQRMRDTLKAAKSEHRAGPDSKRLLDAFATTLLVDPSPTPSL